METVEIARRLAELGRNGDACRAYKLALQQGGERDPAVMMEAALHILRFGGGNDYQISYTVFLSLHNLGCFQEDVLSLMDTAFYEPNVQGQKDRYRENCALLGKYPYLFRKDFPDFDRLPIRFYPFDNDVYTPYDLRTKRFGEYMDPKEPVLRHSFFQDLEHPVLAEDVYSQYELEYLRDNVRKSEYVGRENHIYLHYTDWDTFCAHLAVLDLRPVLREEKVVFLAEEEISWYPMDFQARFGIDYRQYPIKPLGLREIQKMVWHVQLSTHNGGDFFNEVFDGHPNLLAMPSRLLSDIEETVETISRAIGRASSREEALRSFEAWQDPDLVEELYNLRNRTAKDVLAALFFRESGKAGMQAAAGERIVPALFFQPHFTNIVYELELGQNGQAALCSGEYDQICTSPLFRDFKYIKAFTPMRRITTSHGGSVRFAVVSRQIGLSRSDIGLSDLLGIRLLNRSFLIDRSERLFKDCVLVRFEDGKLNPRAVFTALAAFLDLPYTESMTYCSEAGRRDPHPETKGFDPAPVYKTYDEFTCDGERRLLEYLFRDAYEGYGYDFQYYDGGLVDERKVVSGGFAAIDSRIRDSWEQAFQEAARKNETCGEEERRRLQKAGRRPFRLEEAKDGADLQSYLLQPGANPRAALDAYMEQVQAHRLAIIRALMSGPEFVNRQGLPLRMMPELKLDPALLEQPLYH